MRAVAVEIVGRAEHASHQVGMSRIHARVHHRDEHAVAGQVVRRGRRPIVAVGGERDRAIGRDPHPHPREVVEDLFLEMHAHHLHLGNLRDVREPVRRGLDGENLAERGGLGRTDDLRAETFQLLLHARRLMGEADHAQLAMRGNKLRHGQREEPGRKFVIRLEGQHGLGLGQGLQLERRRGIGPHEVGVVGNVGNNFRPHRRELLAEGLRDRPARLHDVAARITLGAQMGRDFGKLRRRINRSVAQQHGVLVAHELRERFHGVAQAEGEGIGEHRIGPVGRDEGQPRSTGRGGAGGARARGEIRDA